MNDPPSETAGLVERFRVGDSRALADLFQRHRDRLRRMVELRMDARIEGRVDFTTPAKFSLTNRQLIIALDPGAPGALIIEGGGFSDSGNASVNGSGVMIVNGGSKYPGTGGTYGSITLSSNVALNLSPATSGTYAGIVFFQPRDNTAAAIQTGNASGITGTIYAPAAALSESGNGALDASLIVDTVAISGNGVADGPAVVAPSAVVGLTVTTQGVGAPSSPAASPSPSSSSAGLMALDSALDDLSTTAGGTASWVKKASNFRIISSQLRQPASA